MSREQLYALADKEITPRECPHTQCHIPGENRCFTCKLNDANYVDGWVRGFERCMSIINERIDSRDFYEVMQTYRHSEITKQSRVVAAFDRVKNFIRTGYPRNADTTHQ